MRDIATRCPAMRTIPPLRANCSHMTGQIQPQLAVVGSGYWPTEMETVFPDKAMNLSAMNALE
jgi:hypothetical protein